MSHRFTRRGFIWQGAAGAAGAALAGCGGPLRTTPNERYLKLPARRSGEVALGMYKHRRWRQACEQAVAAVDDLSWLSRGDSVFVKVACNSDQVHPR